MNDQALKDKFAAVVQQIAMLQDHEMHTLLLLFLTAATTAGKFGVWTQMIDHILIPIGGRSFAKYEGTCTCEQCTNDMQSLIRGQ